jgi:hypothetical protein
MSRRVALVRTDNSEEHIASIIRVEIIAELGASTRVSNTVHQLQITADVVPDSLILSTLKMEEIHSCESAVLTKAARRYIPKYSILHGRDTIGN